jgi:hypothetical protein
MSDEKRSVQALRPEVMREVKEYLSQLRDLRRQEANQRAIFWRRLGRLRGMTVAELARIFELLDQEQFDWVDEIVDKTSPSIGDDQGSEEVARG